VIVEETKQEVGTSFSLLGTMIEKDVKELIIADICELLTLDRA
jgi:hypothetical protein